MLLNLTLKGSGRMVKKLLLAFGVMSLLFPTLAFAADDATVPQLQSAIDAVWVMLAAILVIFMQAGFALIRSGVN